MKSVKGYGRPLWVAGKPIDHTLSPAIHNVAFQRASLPHRYFALEVAPDELQELIDVFREVDALGVNFTIPLKETVCDLVDLKTDSVEALGAANTLYREDGRLKLDNTDVYGFKKLIEPWHDRVKEGPVTLLGAGGAARACLYALGELQCPTIQIWNRTTERAQKLRDEFSSLEIECLSDEELENGAFDGDVVVNSTSLGLQEDDPSPLPASVIRDDMVGVDLIYHRNTTFMDEYLNRGNEAVGGLEMLVYQAARAWERWTGESPNVDVMMNAAREELRNQ